MTESFREQRRNLAKALMEVGAVRSNPFCLDFRTPEHPNKPGSLTPELVYLTASCIKHVVQQLEFDALVSIPEAGKPFEKALELLTGKPSINLNLYEYGKTRCIAGLAVYVPGSIRKVLVMDDYIARGDFKQQAIEVLRSESIEVTDVAVVVDCEQGGREALAELGCTLHCVYTRSKLLLLQEELREQTKLQRRKKIRVHRAQY